MAFIRKFKPGGPVEEKKKLEWDSGTYDLNDYIKAIANANREGYTFTNDQLNLAVNAIKEGKAVRNLDKSWSFTGIPELDNQTVIGPHTKLANGEEVGWRGVQKYDGTKQKSHGIFTDKDTKAERERYHQLGQLAAFLNGILDTQTDLATIPEKPETKKNGQDYFLDALTKEFSTDKKGLTLGSTFADLDNQQKINAMVKILTNLQNSTGYDDYDWSGTPFDTEDKLKEAILSGIDTLNNRVGDDNYEGWKFNRIAQYFTHKDEDPEEVDKATQDPYAIYKNTEDREAAKLYDLQQYFQNELANLQAVWQQKYDDSRNLTWEAHQKFLSRNIKPQSFNLGSTIGDYNYSKPFTMEAMKQLKAQTDWAALSTPRLQQKAIELNGNNIKYLYKTMKYLQENEPEQAQKLFPEVTVDGLPYHAILGSADDNTGVFWIFREDSKGNLVTQIAHASQVQEKLPGSEETFAGNYESDWDKGYKDTYIKNNPLPTLESLNIPEGFVIPAQKQGGTIEKKFKGGSIANSVKLYDADTIKERNIQKSKDTAVNRRLIRSKGDWVEPSLQDIAKITAIGGDVASMFGGFVGLGGGAFSTIANGIADFTDDGITAGEAWANLGINTGLTIASALPGMGVFKAARGLKSIVKFVPWILGTISAVGAVSNLPEMKKAWSNIAAGEYTSRDLQMAGQSIMLLTSAIKGAKTNIQASRMGKSPNIQNTGNLIRTKGGKELNLTNEQKQLLQEAFETNKGDYTKVNEVFKGFGDNFAKEDLPVDLYNGKWFPSFSKLPFRNDRTPNTAKIKITNQEQLPKEGYVYDGRLYSADPILRGIQNWEAPGFSLGRIWSGRSKGKYTPEPKPGKSNPKPNTQGTAKPNETKPNSEASKPNIEQPAVGKATFQGEHAWLNDINFPEGSSVQDLARNSSTFKGLTIGGKKPRRSAKNIQIIKDVKADPTKIDLLKQLEFMKLGGSFNFATNALAIKAAKGTVLKADNGIKFTGTDNWLKRVGNKSLQYILDKVTALNGQEGGSQAYVNTINGMQGSHATLYGNSGFGDNTSANYQGKNYWEDQSVRDYQTQYQNEGFNENALWAQEGDSPYQRQSNNSYNQDWSEGTEPRKGIDGKYAAITDDRRVLGRSKDGVNDFTDEELNEWNSKFKTQGYEIKLGEDRYYRLNPFSAEPVLDNGNDANPEDDPDDKKPEGPKTDVVPEGADQDMGYKSQQKGSMRWDNLLGLARVPFLNRLNTRAYEASIDWSPAMKDYLHRLELVEGDYQSMREAQNGRARLNSKAGRTFTSDASLQLAGQLTGTDQGNQMQLQANRLDSQRQYETRHKVLDLYNQDQVYNLGVHDENAAVWSAYNRWKAGEKKDLILRNGQNWDGFAASIQQQLANGLDRQWQYALETNKSIQDANQKMRYYALQQAIKKDPQSAPRLIAEYTRQNIADQQTFAAQNNSLVGSHIAMNPTIKTEWQSGDHAKNKQGQWQVLGDDGVWKLDPTYKGVTSKKKGGQLDQHGKERLQSAKDFNAAQRENMKEFHRNYRARIKKRK